MTRTLLVVDLKNQVYKAAAMNGTLFHKRTFTGGLYGFTVSLARAIRDTSADRVLVATDAPPYLRKRLYGDYKGDRKGKSDETLVMKASLTMPMIAELLQVIDVPLWSVRGFEYDDLAAYAVGQYAQRFDRIVAMTSDTDLYQLFDYDCFSVYKKAGSLYGRKEFQAEYGQLSREQWVDILSITGTHNAVQGVHGLGPVKARQIINDPELFRATMLKHGELINRNRELIRLPHCAFPEDIDLRIKAHGFDNRDFVRFVQRYDITVTAGMLDALDMMKR